MTNILTIIFLASVACLGFLVLYGIWCVIKEMIATVKNGSINATTTLEKEKKLYKDYLTKKSTRDSH